MPFIDERVKHVGISFLRKINADAIRKGKRDTIYVLQDGDEPLAVLMPYTLFLEMQREKREGQHGQ